MCIRDRTAYSAVTIYYTNEKIYKPLVDFSGVEINLKSTSDGFSARVKVTEIGLIFTLKAVSYTHLSPRQKPRGFPDRKVRSNNQEEV